MGFADDISSCCHWGCEWWGGCHGHSPSLSYCCISYCCSIFDCWCWLFSYTAQLCQCLSKPLRVPWHHFPWRLAAMVGPSRGYAHTHWRFLGILRGARSMLLWASIPAGWHVLVHALSFSTTTVEVSVLFFSFFSCLFFLVVNHVFCFGFSYVSNSVTILNLV